VIALLVSGMLIMTTATIVLGDIAIQAWHYGWTARIVAFLLFLTSPAAMSTALFDYRNTRYLDTARKRLACLGVSLAILGGLELVLATCEFYFLVAIGVGYIY
jgi:hypothetical protein